MREHRRQRAPDGVGRGAFRHEVDDEPAPGDAARDQERAQRRLKRVRADIGGWRTDPELGAGQRAGFGFDPARHGAGQQHRRGPAVALSDERPPHRPSDVAQPRRREQGNGVLGRRANETGAVGADQPLRIRSQEPVETGRLDSQRLIGRGHGPPEPVDEAERAQPLERRHLGPDRDGRRVVGRGRDDRAGEAERGIAASEVVVERSEQPVEADVEIGDKHRQEQLDRNLVAADELHDLRQRRVREGSVVELAQEVAERAVDAARGCVRDLHEFGEPALERFPGERERRRLIAPPRPDLDEVSCRELDPAHRRVEHLDALGIDLRLDRHRQVGRRRAGLPSGRPRPEAQDLARSRPVGLLGPGLRQGANDVGQLLERGIAKRQVRGSGFDRERNDVEVGADRPDRGDDRRDRRLATDDDDDADALLRADKPHADAGSDRPRRLERDRIVVAQRLEETVDRIVLADLDDEDGRLADHQAALPNRRDAR